MGTANHILALDQGTTSSRAMVFDRSLGRSRSPGSQRPRSIPIRVGSIRMRPKSGQRRSQTARDALRQARLAGRDIAGIGIVNQRETLVVWDRRDESSGRRPQLSGRAARVSRRSRRCLTRGMGPAYQSKTGLVPDAYFTASKLAWLLEDQPDLRRRAEAGELLAGTVDSWLLWNLTGGAVHATDVSNASRTMLFDIQTLEWSTELARRTWRSRADVAPRRVQRGCCRFTAPELFGAEIPVSGIAGDQQAALFGQTCFAPGEAKNTYGTGSFLLMNTGSEMKRSAHRLLSTIAWRIGEQVDYALEGSVFISGAAVEWLRDGLGIIEAVAGRRVARGFGPGYRRGDGRSRIDRARRSALGRRGSGHDSRPHPGFDGGPHRPRHARSDRVSDPRRDRRHDRRLGDSVDELARRRWCGSQRSPDADPGRCARRPGHPAKECRNNRGRRRISRRTRLRPMARPGFAWRIAGPSTASSNPRSATRSARAGTRSGDSPSIDPAAGRRLDELGIYSRLSGSSIAGLDAPPATGNHRAFSRALRDLAVLLEYASQPGQIELTKQLGGLPHKVFHL